MRKTEKTCAHLWKGVSPVPKYEVSLDVHLSLKVPVEADTPEKAMAIAKDSYQDHLDGADTEEIEVGEIYDTDAKKPVYKD